MAKKAASVSGGKRGSTMSAPGGKKTVNFTPYTGNIVQSSTKSGLHGGAKKAKPGKAT